MRTSIQTAHITNVGRVREKNEDSVYAALTTLPLAKEMGIEALLLVADGVGGHSYGQEASQQAVITVQELFHDEEFLRGSGSVQDALTRAVQTANERVFRLAGKETLQKPGSTMTLVALNASTITISHVGDSRAYLVTRDGWQQLTQDDSYVAEAVRSGQMTEEEAKVSPLRNRISKCLGQKPEISPSESDHAWMPGDIVYLCSDGLSEYVEGSGAAIVFYEQRNLQHACEELVRLANEGGGHDNISVAAAKNALNRVSHASPTRSFEAPVKRGYRWFLPVAGALLFLIAAALAASITTWILNSSKRAKRDEKVGFSLSKGQPFLDVAKVEGELSNLIVIIEAPGYELTCEQEVGAKGALRSHESGSKWTYTTMDRAAFKDLKNGEAFIIFSDTEKHEKRLRFNDFRTSYPFHLKEEGKYSLSFKHSRRNLVKLMSFEVKRRL